ncbi:MAG TPA: hypothetical protein VGM94_03215 [Galbitalea sp.]
MSDTESTTTAEYTPIPGPRRHVRVGTIVWGAILVGIAVFAILVLTTGPLTGAAVLWSVVGFGALLLIAALVAAIVRAARGGRSHGHPPIG